MPGKIEVVNAKTFSGLSPGTLVHYIGRFNPRWGSSDLHNRWSHYPQSNALRVATREESIVKFKKWFLEIQRRFQNNWSVTGSEWKALVEFNHLKEIFSQTTPDQTLYLVCWCAPKPCHGDFLRELLLQSASL